VTTPLCLNAIRRSHNAVELANHKDARGSPLIECSSQSKSVFRAMGQGFAGFLPSEVIFGIKSKH
jgi:hypothetical protein